MPKPTQANVITSDHPVDADDAVNESDNAERRDDRTRDIEGAGGFLRFMDVAFRGHHHRNADGQVDEKPDAPRQPVGQKSADHQAEGG